MCSENGKAIGRFVNPFVPSHTPAIVMNLNLVLIHVDDLGLQPLFYGVLGVNPHANFIFTLRKIILLDILIIFSIFRRLNILSFSKPSTRIDILHMIFFLQSFLVLHSGFHQAPDVLMSSSKNIK